MRVALFQHKIIQARNAQKGHKYLCPFCYRRVIVHQLGNNYQYFVHYNHNINCGGESSEHLLGKVQIADFFYDYSHNIKIEKHLLRIHQWPDILIKDSIVIEFQCSPISSDTLSSRINGYLKVNLKSWWILGNPYYSRRLRFKYLGRFMRYSPFIGFYLAFWLTNFCCLEIRYQFREVNGKLSYRYKWIKTFKELHDFVNSPQLMANQSIIKIKKDLHLVQQRMFHQDLDTIQLQVYLNRFSLTVDDCPLICHKLSTNPPIFKGKILMWHIWILLLLRRNYPLKIVYYQANQKLGFPLRFIQIQQIKRFYYRAFNDYIYLLIFEKYLTVKGGYVVNWHMPTWFRSFYDKECFLNRYYQ